MRIGIMGGTFNPVHIAHLISAEEICERFRLDKIIFVPACITPFKEKEKILNPQLRINMLKLAIENNKKFFLSTIEIERGGVSYSIDTFEELKTRIKGISEIFILTGMDVFRNIAAWKSTEKLLTSYNFIVNARPDYEIDNILDILNKNITKKHNRICFINLGLDKTYNSKKIGISTSSHNIYITETTPINLSSSIIRKRISEKKTVKYLLTNKVERFIIDNNLYG